MAKATKFYAIKNGAKIGIFTSWDEAKSYVTGFPGAVYKSFPTLEDAKSYLGEGGYDPSKNYQEPPQKQKIKEKKKVVSKEKSAVAYVDGSYYQEKDAVGGGVFYKDSEDEFNISFSTSNNEGMRNVKGEIEASKMAIMTAMTRGKEKIDIYHDYEGISKWPNGDWSANKKETQSYAEFVKKCRNSGMQIIFHHVKAHTGVPGNEKADRLANIGTEL